MSKSLENKLALVTGSSRGIGAAIATRLAAEGAYVIVNYAASPGRAEQVVGAIAKADGHAEAVGADLGSTEGTKVLIASIDKAFGGKFGGRLDILVNNAGTVEFGPFLDSSENSYDKHFNLNVRSLIELSKDAAKRMTKSGWARIINIGSAFGEAAPLAGVTMYIATKFAVHGFTRGLSRELGFDRRDRQRWPRNANVYIAPVKKPLLVEAGSSPEGAASLREEALCTA